MQHQFGLPEIFEHEAKGSLAELYQDIRYVLKVPIVNFVFRTLAHYERFLEVAWMQVRPNLLTMNMEQAAADLRYPHISFDAPVKDWGKYYSNKTIETIRRVILTFNYVNTKLLLITTSWEESLGYRPITGSNQVKGVIQPGVYKGLPKVELIDIPKASLSVQHLLMDIISKKHGYDAASDFRALAQFPYFFHGTWSHIREYVNTDEYILMTSKIKSNARTLVHESSPYPVSMTPEYLHHLYAAKDVAGIMGIISMFSNLIAGLIIDGECFRRFLP